MYRVVVSAPAYPLGIARRETRGGPSLQERSTRAFSLLPSLAAYGDALGRGRAEQGKGVDGRRAASLLP